MDFQWIISIYENIVCFVYCFVYCSCMNNPPHREQEVATSCRWRYLKVSDVVDCLVVEVVELLSPARSHLSNLWVKQILRNNYKSKELLYFVFDINTDRPNNRPGHVGSFIGKLHLKLTICPNLLYHNRNLKKTSPRPTNTFQACLFHAPYLLFRLLLLITLIR